MKGTFIVFEGPDGSGSTTQAQLLAEKFRAEGRDVLLTNEPTDGDIGKLIRTELKKDAISFATVQLLFCADRAEHLELEVLPALERGTIVICDRYALSTLVYGEASNIDRSWLESINAAFRKPDLTLIMLPPVETCLERIHGRATKEIFEENTFQRKVYELYVDAAREMPHAHVIDTSKPLEQTSQAIIETVQSFLNS